MSLVQGNFDLTAFAQHATKTAPFSFPSALEQQGHNDALGEFEHGIVLVPFLQTAHTYNHFLDHWKVESTNEREQHSCIEFIFW
jgi:hypothetical protein